MPPESFIPTLETPVFDIGNTGPMHLSDILKSFPNKSSLDADGISLRLLKFVAIEISSPLAHIFNLSLDNGIFPARLKNSRTVPIFKSGDQTLCDNYRPISLIATFSKVLEKMVAIKLTNHLQINKLLYAHQYGFQRFHSTEQNLIQVVNNIGAALNRGNFCIGIFLDLRKAFDTCSHTILLKKLSKLGVNDTALDWFKSYLSDRTQQVDINGNLSNRLKISYGVLQGSILGPILFLCYINDIYSATKLATFLFADDTTCLAEHKNLNELINFVNVELNKLSSWVRANKMAINVTKTNYIIFHTKGKQIDNTDVDIVFDCNEISKTHDPKLVFKLERIYDKHPNEKPRSFKLLGVFFDENLTFNKHCSYVGSKLSRSIFCMKRAANFLSLKSLRSLYFAMVHSHLIYCPIILSCTSSTNLSTIGKLQKKAIRIMTKSTYNTHTGPLFLANKILPFDKLILQSKLLFFHSIVYKYAPRSFSEIWMKNNEGELDYNLRNLDLYVIPQIRIEQFRQIPLTSLPTA